MVQDFSSHVKKYEELFTVSPDKLKSIVNDFIDTLQRGLDMNHQTVVSI